MQNHSREHNGHHTQQLDENIDGRPGSILEGIPHGVADHGRLVGLAALAAVFAALDVFLGIVPGIMTARMKPQAVAPASIPITPLTPRINPVSRGAAMATTAGRIISFWADLVQISTQAS